MSIARVATVLGVIGLAITAATNGTGPFTADIVLVVVGLVVVAAATGCGD